MALLKIALKFQTPSVLVWLITLHGLSRSDGAFFSGTVPQGLANMGLANIGFASTDFGPWGEPPVPAGVSLRRSFTADLETNSTTEVSHLEKQILELLRPKQPVAKSLHQELLRPQQTPSRSAPVRRTPGTQGPAGRPSSLRPVSIVMREYRAGREDSVSPKDRPLLRLSDISEDGGISSAATAIPRSCSRQCGAGGLHDFA